MLEAPDCCQLLTAEMLLLPRSGVLNEGERLEAGAVARLVENAGGVVSGVSTSNHPVLAHRSGDHAMADATTHSSIPHVEGESSAHLFDDWFDPIEAAVRGRVREFIQGLIEDELETTLLRPRT